MSSKSKTIEEKMNELRNALAWFEGDDFTLEQASEKFKKAAALATEIEHDLKNLENQITVLKQSFEEV
jgi:exodeoxyribonuclease VII small subunit